MRTKKTGLLSFKGLLMRTITNGYVKAILRLIQELTDADLLAPIRVEQRRAGEDKRPLVPDAVLAGAGGAAEHCVDGGVNGSWEMGEDLDLLNTMLGLSGSAEHHAGSIIYTS